MADANGDLNPALQEWLENFNTPDSKAWAMGTAQRLQQHFTARAITDNAHAAGNAVITNMAKFRNTLMGMVRSDPTSLHAMLDLVPHTVNAIVAQHGLSDDEADAHAAALTRDVSSEVAHAGVQGAAARNPDYARTVLNSPRVQSLLTAGDAGALDQYITTMAGVRAQDVAAQKQQLRRSAAQSGYVKAGQWLDTLRDPATGRMQFPPDFGTSVMQDSDLSKMTRASLLHGYGNLMARGDVPISNPNLTADIIRRAAMPGGRVTQDEVLQQLGRGLTLNDARAMNALISPATPPELVQQLHGMVSNAREQIAPPQNGPAGQNAFGRFMQWLVPAFHADPAGAQTAIANGRMQDFAPTIADHLAVGRQPSQPLNELWAQNSGPGVVRPVPPNAPGPPGSEGNFGPGREGPGGSFELRLNQPGGGATIPLQG